MSDEETRLKHSQRRKRNIFAKVLYDPNEFRGAYSMKVVENKNKYKREKLSIKNINIEEENE
ncbi:MAG TPA: hypothetical protein PLS50_00575 [Candidatus Dojkabacteria bacterium]|nr:hypothetical protein [Candidatus Dojkabacteria bacterium]